MQVPVQTLISSESYLPALDGFAATFAAGTQFAYNNSGYAILAVLAERASGQAFPHLVARRVLMPANMHRTAFLSSEELPGNALRAGLLVGAHGARGHPRRRRSSAPKTAALVHSAASSVNGKAIRQRSSAERSTTRDSRPGPARLTPVNRPCRGVEPAGRRQPGEDAPVIRSSSSRAASAITVPGPKTAVAPASRSAGRSATGITPPTTMRMSPRPAA